MLRFAFGLMQNYGSKGTLPDYLSLIRSTVYEEIACQAFIMKSLRNKINLI